MESRNRRVVLGIGCLSLLWGFGGRTEANPIENPPGRFVRGDANNDGGRDISDPVFLLSFLFSGGSPPVCDEAADINDDGAWDISDPVFFLTYLFLGGTPPPQPFPACGLDPRGTLCPISSCNPISG